MEKRNRTTVFNAIVVAVLLIYAYSARYVFPQQATFMKTVRDLSRAMIHLGIVIVWMASIKRRIMQDSVRFYLLAVAVLLIFWLYIRAVKWYFFYEICTPVRYLWYGYYIPIILIPLFGVFLIEYIGKKDTYEMPKRMRLLYIPAFVLIGLVFTNDFHRLVFDFPEGMESFSSVYTYEAVYFLVILWAVCLAFYFVIMLLLKCRAPGSRWFQRMPILVILGALIVWMIYCLRLVFYDLTAVSCFIIILLLESSIQSGLIRSNSQYEVLFQASSIEAQIVDDKYHVCYGSETSGFLDEKIMRKAETGPVNLGDKRLASAKIRHGHILWWDDITRINRFTKELEETGKRLAESNDLMKAELDLQEKNLRMMEKNRLYDRIVSEVRGQIDRLEQLLTEETADSPIRENLIQICIISAYVKRRSNLLLMSENTAEIPAREMEFCLRESLDNIRLAGVMCSMDSHCEGKTCAQHLVDAYDLFQQLLEQTLRDLHALFIKLRISGGDIFLRLQMDCCESELIRDREESAWVASGGSAAVRRSDDTLWVELRMEGGKRI